MQESSEKENKKVQTDKQFDDNEVREGKADNSIFDEENNKSSYPYPTAQNKDDKAKPEYISKNADKKDKG